MSQKIKAAAAVVFMVEATEYGWSVREGARRLGLFVTQAQALLDVKKRQKDLKAKGLSSSVVVTGEEKSPRYSRSFAR
jgi:hypothetical protein